MKLNIHYPVLARGIPERGVKERMILLSDSADFEIPEYSSRDLVRAATFRGRSPERLPMIYSLDGALYSNMSGTTVNPTDFQAVDFIFGKFRAFPIERPWAALHVEQHNAIQQIRDDCGTQLSSSLSPETAANVVADRETVACLTHRNEYRYKAIDEVAFVESRKKMQEALSRIIMVDGRLWRQCHAPVVSYCPLMGVPPTRAINAHVLEAPHFRSEAELLEPLGMSLNIVCGADDAEEGVTLAKEITARFPGSSTGDHELRYLNGEFVAHEPVLLATDAAALGILQCAISASEWMATKLMRGRGDYDDHTSMQRKIINNVTSVSVSDIATLKGLVDGIARANAHGVDDALADYVRAAFDSPMFFSTIQDEEVSLGIVNACLDRWDNEPISVLAVTNPGPALRS
jgi:hypothetical protein